MTLRPMKGFCYSLKTPFKNFTVIVLLLVFIAICLVSFFHAFGDVVICVNETHVNFAETFSEIQKYEHACRNAKA